MIRPAAEAIPDRDVPLLVIGAGACGLCAALAARDAGVAVTILERDVVPGGNTAYSVAMIPAAGSRIQRAAGIEDDASLFAADILAKTKGRTDPVIARRLAEESGPTIDWLTERHGLHLSLLTELIYPGHRRHRYHVPPTITGVELHTMLLTAARAAGAEILTGHRVETLYADATGRVAAVGGDGWTIGCDALVLATDGFGASRDKVDALIPDMRGAARYGHDGAQGDALDWGQALGAATADLGAYQGHSLTTWHGITQTWALVIDGAIQVNRAGRRFANEMRGYSEQAADIVRQPGGVAWTIYDRETEINALLLANYREIVARGGVVTGETIADLAGTTGLPADALAETIRLRDAAAREERPDAFGRSFPARALSPPYRAVEVQGALFHTQGGLVVDGDGRVLRPDGRPLPNLFAGGGAARGVSGPDASGYLGGNGLLSAVVLGRLAGRAAAIQGD